MNNLLNKIFFRSQNLNYINLGFRNIIKNRVKKIFDAINSFSKIVRYDMLVGVLEKLLIKKKLMI